jgi:hypothetical protein
MNLASTETSSVGADVFVARLLVTNARSTGASPAGAALPRRLLIGAEAAERVRARNFGSRSTFGIQKKDASRIWRG